MSEKPTTGYGACQSMVSVIEAEISHMRAKQRRRGHDEDMANEVRALSQACAVLQAEIRKTGDDADKAVNNLPPERQVELILKMIREMSPEHRQAVSLYCDELGVRLQ